MEQAVLIGYFFSLSILFVFGLHGFVMMYYHRKYGHKNPEPDINFKEGAIVTIQLPLYNEMYVIERLQQEMNYAVVSEHYSSKLKTDAM